MPIIVKKDHQAFTSPNLYSYGRQVVKLVVGLGNPGSKYLMNRHNLGFMCLDALVKRHDLQWQTSDKFKGLFAKERFNGTHLILFKPNTYMNLSGEAVVKITQFYKLDLEDVYFIYDDAKLDFKNIALKNSDQVYGHNGLKSIINQFPNQSLQLIRVGVGPKPKDLDLADFVLSNFDKSQIPILSQILREVTSIIEEIVAVGFIEQNRSL